MDQSDKKVLLLELGVGEMTPSIIKLPFWELTAKNENVFYACLNREAADVYKRQYLWFTIPKNLLHLPTFAYYHQDIIVHIQVAHQYQVYLMRSLIQEWFLSSSQLPNRDVYKRQVLRYVLRCGHDSGSHP